MLTSKPHHHLALKCIIFILALLPLSYATYLTEGVTRDLVDDTLTSALTTFGIAKAVSASLATIASTQTEIGFAGTGFQISVGQMASSVYEIADEFAEVMKIAIGSIVFQKIIFSISSNDYFNLLLGCLLLVLFITYSKRLSELMRSRLYKITLFVAFLKLGPIFILGMTALIDQVFVADEINERQQILESSPLINTNDNESLGAVGYMKSMMSSMGEKIDTLKSYADHMLILSIVFLFKTIFVPLVFIYCTAKFFKLLVANTETS